MLLTLLPPAAEQLPQFAASTACQAFCIPHTWVLQMRNSPEIKQRIFSPLGGAISTSAGLLASPHQDADPQCMPTNNNHQTIRGGKVPTYGVTGKAFEAL